MPRAPPLERPFRGDGIGRVGPDVVACVCLLSQTEEEDNAACDASPTSAQASCETCALTDTPIEYEVRAAAVGALAPKGFRPRREPWPS